MDSTSGNKDSSDNASSRNGSSTGSKSSSTSSASDISRRNANSTEETSPDQSDLPWRCLGVDCEPAAITFATRVATELCPDILHANKGDYLSMEGVNQPLPETLISASFIKEGSVRSKAAQSTAAYDSNSKKGESTFHRPCGLEFAVADGWNSALYEEARFDAIHVGAAGSWVCSCSHEFRFIYTSCFVDKMNRMQFSSAFTAYLHALIPSTLPPSPLSNPLPSFTLCVFQRTKCPFPCFEHWRLEVAW